MVAAYPFFVSVCVGGGGGEWVGVIRRVLKAKIVGAILFMFMLRRLFTKCSMVWNFPHVVC